MNCKHCNKVIVGSMKFCPYCGNKTDDGEISRISNDLTSWEQMKGLYHDGNHQKLLTYALEGDIFAKFYYLRYISDMANQKSLSTETEIARKLKKHMDEGSVFAKAILGLCCYVYKISFSGITDDWDESTGKRLIRESAESEEPLAMVFWGNLLFNGYKVEKDVFTAYKMMKSAADQGYPPAIYTLGLWHCQGTAGISKNEELGTSMIENAAFLGDLSAKNYIRKEDSKWLDTELSYSISDDDIGNTMALIADKTNVDNTMIPMALCEEYERCQCKEDYIRLYKLLRDEYADDENIRDLFESLKQFIIGITGYSLDKMSIEDAEAWEKVMGRIEELTDRYTLPQHYLHFKDDIKTLEIDITEEDIPNAMRNISQGLRNKCEKDVEKYIAYSKAKADTSAEGFGCVMTISILMVVLGFMFFPVVAWIAIGFILLCGLARLSLQVTFNKISITNKENYLLVNELIGYGYSLFKKSDWDPKYSYGEYNEKEVYNNTVPSVLSENITTETK